MIKSIRYCSTIIEISRLTNMSGLKTKTHSKTNFGMGSKIAIVEQIMVRMNILFSFSKGNIFPKKAS